MEPLGVALFCCVVALVTSLVPSIPGAVGSGAADAQLGTALKAFGRVVEFEQDLLESLPEFPTPKFLQHSLKNYLLQEARVAALAGHTLTEKPEMYSPQWMLEREAMRMSLPPGYVDAAVFGFLPSSFPWSNARALQRAVDLGGTIIVSRPGVYELSKTVYVGSNTKLVFGHGVVVKKRGKFAHILLNKGARNRTWDRHISIVGLHIAVSGVDQILFSDVRGLRGQLSFFYVKDLRISHFRCLDLGAQQFAIQVCTFEDLRIDDVVIKGKKDGIHLGPGRRFHIRDAVFETYDDAIALNGHDYWSANPEVGWIEDGVVENAVDLWSNSSTGFFARLLAGAWSDWREGMEVQNSDAVVSQGRVYRVVAEPDGKTYKSVTRPTHAQGSVRLDGEINWMMQQIGEVYTAGVRSVVFRDIFLRKPRIGFSIHFDSGNFSRSYYPGAQMPNQEWLSFDNIQMLADPISYYTRSAFSVSAPVNVLKIMNSRFREHRILFLGGKGNVTERRETWLQLIGCSFTHTGPMKFLVNEVPNNTVHLVTIGSVVVSKGFLAKVDQGPGNITVHSDLPGLRVRK